MNFKNNKLELSIKRKSDSALIHWIVQKISALVLLPLVIWFLYIFKDFVYQDYENKIIWMQDITNSALLALFFLVALFHLRLGLTVVVEDYVHSARNKSFLLKVIAILCLLLAVFTVIVIFMISKGNNV